MRMVKLLRALRSAELFFFWGIALNEVPGRCSSLLISSYTAVLALCAVVQIKSREREKRVH